MFDVHSYDSLPKTKIPDDHYHGFGDANHTCIQHTPRHLHWLVTPPTPYHRSLACFLTVIKEANTSEIHLPTQNCRSLRNKG